MYSGRDTFGLLAALIAVAVLLWLGVTRFSAQGAHGTGAPVSDSAVGGHGSTLAYLAHLQRIDAPVESYERRAGRVLHEELASPGPMSAAAKQEMISIAESYEGAARDVERVQPAPGFERAQHLLAKTYEDQAASDRSVLLLTNGKTVQNDPQAVLDELRQIDATLGRFNRDLTACRAAFQDATTAAGVPDPAWVLALINHSTGQSG
jgi:hypothetical protein